VFSFPAVNAPPNISVLKSSNTLQPITDNLSSRTFPRKSLYNEPIWEGDDDVNQTSTHNDQRNSIDFTALGNWNSRFYQTMPHSMPSFVQGNTRKNFFENFEALKLHYFPFNLHFH
jgi:hypothetical protein